MDEQMKGYTDGWMNDYINMYDCTWLDGWINDRSMNEWTDR